MMLGRGLALDQPAAASLTVDRSRNGKSTPLSHRRRRGVPVASWTGSGPHRQAVVTARRSHRAGIAPPPRAITGGNDRRGELLAILQS
jgi:hypothetical protein